MLKLMLILYLNWNNKLEMVVQIATDTQKTIVLKKLNTFFDFDKYKDFLLLDSEEFEVKYGSIGFCFQNFVCIRFSKDPDIFKEICDFLPNVEYYLIPISKEPTSIFTIATNDIEIFLNKADISDFVIFESKLSWLLVYDRYRKLFGLGDYIKERINQHVNLKFGNAKIMFTNTDKL